MRQKRTKRPDVRNRNCFTTGPGHPAWKGGERAWRNRSNRRKRATLAVAKWLVLWYYGSGSPHCDCCDEQIIEFLAVNHKEGNGRKDRGNHGGSFYAVIADRGFPDVYNVLCHNCNMASGFYGECPHGKRSKARRS